MTYYIGQRIYVPTKLSVTSSRYVQARVLDPNGYIQTVACNVLGNGTSILDSSLYALSLIPTLVGQYVISFEVYTSAIGGTQTFDEFANAAESYKIVNIITHPLDDFVRPHSLTSGSLGNVLINILNAFGSARELKGDEEAKIIEAPNGTMVTIVSRSDKKMIGTYVVEQNNRLLVNLRPGTYDIYFKNCFGELCQNVETVTIRGGGCLT